MMGWRCSRESDTARAASAGEWPEGLRTHAAGCPICRDVALVAATLDRARRYLPAGPPVANAGRIWWMARIRARRADAERALRPISVMELVAIAAAVPFVAAGLASALPGVVSWLGELRLMPVVAGIGGHVTLPGVTVATSAALVVLVLALVRAVTGTGR